MDYQGVIRDLGFLMVAVMVIVSCVSLFLRFRLRSFLKTAFVVLLACASLFLIFEISPLGILCFIVAFMLGLSAISYINASVAWPLTASKFAVTALLACLLLGEDLSIQTGLGIFFVILGSMIMVIVNSKKDRKPSE
jgi:multidrug transporter EmrE-like cation transporter